MQKWHVKVFRVGRISVDQTVMTRFKGFGQKIIIPIWCTALTDGISKVLVDTGIGDLDWVVSGPEPSCMQTKEEETIKALHMAMGWDPGDVDIVINTHLHFDHCGRNNQFKNAQIYIQKDELEAAFEPLNSEARLYRQECFDKNAVPYFQWKQIEGEHEIADGLIVFPTPGHTKGHQSVLVDTYEGALCVAGDVVPTIENINDKIESSVVINTEQVFKSFDAIRRRATFIIPGHEPEIENYSENKFPRIL